MVKYSISDIATTFSVSERTAQRWVESLILRQGNKMFIEEDVFDLLKSRHAHDKENTDFERIEYFTEEEYQEFHKRLAEYPHLKEQIQYVLKDLEYYRKSMGSKERQMELLLLAITNKRFLEEPNEE